MSSGEGQTQQRRTPVGCHEPPALLFSHAASALFQSGCLLSFAGVAGRRDRFDTFAEILQLRPQDPIGLLKQEHFVAQLAEIIARLAGGAQGFERPNGGLSFRSIPVCRSELLERGYGPRIFLTRIFHKSS